MAARLPFTFRPLANLPDLVLVEARIFRDDRGAFLETYKRSEFAAHGIPFDFVQDNHAVSTKRGVLRGLHHQVEPMAQGKLVRCLRGAVWDVAVDIRKGSPTFAKWAGLELREDDGRMLWVPPGFAHGYVTVTERAEVLYKTTAEYSPPHERTIRWDDPEIGIAWPVKEPLLAEKDAKAPTLREVAL